MNLKSFRALQAENPRNAMIFDLTERFPRGPKAKLRKADYSNPGWGEPESDKLVGGDLGYDLFEVYALAKEGLWESHLCQIVTSVEGAAMGRALLMRDEEGNHVPNGSWQLFKRGPQITRRLRRLQNRLRGVVRQVEATSKKNIYNVRVGDMSESFSCYGHDSQEAEQVFGMLLKGAFSAASETGLFRGRSWGRHSSEEAITFTTDYAGPAHGPHEILAQNTQFSDAMRKRASKMKEQIAQLEKQIEAAHDLAQMMDMFTMNTCAAFTEDV